MKIATYIYSLCVIVLLQSCVKDTDFDQAEDIVFTPEVELDLIYFNLDASEFFDEVSNTPRFTVSDTTALEFLDASAITGSIQKIDFLFDFNNAIPRTFEVEFQFLKNNNNITYTTGTSVAAGVNGTAVQTLFPEEVMGEELDNIELASKVVVNVTIPAADETLAGNLTLQSKATYFIEY